MEKQKGRPVFGPSDFKAYLAERKGVPKSEISVPEDIIFTYDTGIFRAAIARTAAVPVSWYIYHDRLYRGMIDGKPVGIVHAMVGAPAASMNLEELVAYGARRVYELGLSGAIDTALEPGDIVVLGGAYSDEGTSKHYYRANSKRFDSSPSLTRRVRASLREVNMKHVFGDAWTVDAPYRETVEKILRFRRKGARIVNMESSAIFAIANYRGVDVCSIQIVSDVVTERGWAAAFHKEIVDRRRNEVLAAVLHLLRGERSNPGRRF
jgi:uridine phosphorylase